MEVMDGTRLDGVIGGIPWSGQRGLLWKNKRKTFKKHF